MIAKLRQKNETNKDLYVFYTQPVQIQICVLFKKYRTRLAGLMLLIIESQGQVLLIRLKITKTDGKEKRNTK